MYVYYITQFFEASNTEDNYVIDHILTQIILRKS